MLKVAVGPEKRETPSWHYFSDIQKILGRYYNSVTFPARQLVYADVSLTVKHISYIKNCRTSGKIYIPVDFFKKQQDIVTYKHLLQKADLIICNSLPLMAYLYEYKPIFIPHNIKYTSLKINKRLDDYVLWIGNIPYIQYLKEWWNENNPTFKIHCLCSELFDPAKVGFKNPKYITVEEWTPSLQLYHLNKCAAGIDIKGESFWQTTKPNTKAFEFIVAGVPFATNCPNQHKFLLNYFDFNAAKPENEKWWFSDQYYDYSQIYAEKLYENLNIEVIGRMYKSAIDKLRV